MSFILTWLVAYMIPDMPSDVHRLMLYEKQLINKINFDATFGSKKNANSREPSVTHQPNSYQGGLAYNNDIYGVNGLDKGELYMEVT